MSLRHPVHEVIGRFCGNAAHFLQKDLAVCYGNIGLFLGEYIRLFLGEYRARPWENIGLFLGEFRALS